MAKKKDKPQVINNIQQLNLEIDYDQFAEAIVKAKNKSEEINLPKEKTGFWKAVWLIIRNKERKTGKRTSILLSEVIAFMFNSMAIIVPLFFIAVAVLSIINMDWSASVFEGVAQCVIVCFLIFSSLCFSFICRAIANEIKAEKDRNYIISVFSGIVSFAALIVALVALFKGVG